MGHEVTTKFPQLNQNNKKKINEHVHNKTILIKRESKSNKKNGHAKHKDNRGKQCKTHKPNTK